MQFIYRSLFLTVYVLLISSRYCIGATVPLYINGIPLRSLAEEISPEKILKIESTAYIQLVKKFPKLADYSEQQIGELLALNLIIKKNKKQNDETSGRTYEFSISGFGTLEIIDGERIFADHVFNAKIVKKMIQRSQFYSLERKSLKSLQSSKYYEDLRRHTEDHKIDHAKHNLAHLYESLEPEATFMPDRISEEDFLIFFGEIIESLDFSKSLSAKEFYKILESANPAVWLDPDDTKDKAKASKLDEKLRLKLTEHRRIEGLIRDNIVQLKREQQDLLAQGLSLSSEAKSLMNEIDKMNTELRELTKRAETYQDMLPKLIDSLRAQHQVAKLNVEPLENIVLIGRSRLATVFSAHLNGIIAQKLEILAKIERDNWTNHKVSVEITPKILSAVINHSWLRLGSVTELQVVLQLKAHIQTPAGHGDVQKTTLTHNFDGSVASLRALETDISDFMNTLHMLANDAAQHESITPFDSLLDAATAACEQSLSTGSAPDTRIPE